jgi:hypothetical protein
MDVVRELIYLKGLYVAEGYVPATQTIGKIYLFTSISDTLKIPVVGSPSVPTLQLHS